MRLSQIISDEFMIWIHKPNYNENLAFVIKIDFAFCVTETTKLTIAKVIKIYIKKTIAQCKICHDSYEYKHYKNIRRKIGSGGKSLKRMLSSG